MDMGSFNYDMDVMIEEVWTNWNIFLDQFLPMGRGKMGYESTSQLDYYMADPEIAHPVLDPGSFIAPPEAYDVRLQQLMNGVWFCMNGESAISAGLSNQTSYLNSTNVSFARDNSPYPSVASWGTAWPAVGTKSTKTTVIVAHKGWVAALTIASTVLIISSLIPSIVRWSLTKGPDLRMNISSLATRDNPYIPLPENGTFMDAAERSRVLKDLTLRFGDVDRRAHGGRLAIALLHRPGRSNVARVRKGYFYE